jgi:glutamine amidotransferase-like uncharacterized protein
MTIRIYNGKGTSRNSLRHTFHTFSNYAPAKYQVSYISAEEIILGEWFDDTALLIIPGGADIHYCKYLNGKGNMQIRKYLMQGGSFLGICAGAYYGGSFIEFAKSSPIEVIGDRELAIYNGIVSGPALCKYYYNSNKGARAAGITFDITGGYSESVVFYNGGGYFVNAENTPDTKVIAHYQDCRASIIMRKFGGGRAILSGVHFEYNPYLMKSSKLLDPIIYLLKKHNESRDMLVQHIINMLII